MTESSTTPELQFQAIALNILIDSDSFAGVFDELEIWRSADKGQPYTEITGPSWRPAVIPHDAGPIPDHLVAGPLVNISGFQLSVLSLNGDMARLDYDFVSSDASLLKDVAAQITTQGQGRVHSYVDALGRLVLESTAAGTGSYLRVLPSDAASFLGLPLSLPDSEAYGKDARIRLVNGLEQYAFTDQLGSPTTSYKIRCSNSITLEKGPFSVSFTGKQAIGVTASNLVTGTLSLVGADGKPLCGVEVSIHPTFRGASVEGKIVAGADLVDSTNSDGYVEFVLVRGQPYTLGIAGTNIVKDFTAPTDSSITAFSLVDPSVCSQEDYFKVRVPDLPTLERRSI